MNTASRHYKYRFDSLMHAHPDERDSLAEMLTRQGVSPIFELHALRRRRQWATTLPVGAFCGDFREGVASYDEELDARANALKEAASLYRFYVLPNRRQFHWAGNDYISAVVIAGVRHVVQPRWFLNSLHNFLEDAEKNPALIRGVKPRAKHDGHGRGPAWSPEEDMVLRQWFGPRAYGDNAGKHAKLTDVEWAKVLDRLGGVRSAIAVRERIKALNHALKVELTVDGYIPRNRYPDYFARVLGENPRPPRSTPVRRRRASRPRSESTSVPHRPQAPAPSPTISSR